MAGKTSNTPGGQKRDRADLKAAPGEHGSQSQPGVMGDQTMAQSLNQKGQPDAARSRKEAEEAFRQSRTAGKSDRR